MNNCIIYITNDIYLAYCVNSIKSLIEKNRNINIPIYILHTGLNILNRLENCKNKKNYIYKNLHFLNCKDLYEKYIIKNFKSKAFISHLKWIIPLLDFFYTYDNILYLDTDTQIVGDINDIFLLETDKHIIGVDDVINHHNNINEYRIIYKYGYKLEHYINSGVMLFKPRNINTMKFSIIFNNIIDRYNKMELYLKDQDMININFNIECLYDYKYNYFVTPKTKMPDVKDIRIKHYLQKELMFKTLLDTISIPEF